MRVCKMPQWTDIGNIFRKSEELAGRALYRRGEFLPGG